MALSTKVTSFEWTQGSSANIDVTCGFQPKFVILWTSGNDGATDEVERADLEGCIGVFADDGTRWVYASRSRDSVGTSSAASVLSDAACVAELDSDTPAITGALDIDAKVNWPGTGFRLNVDDTSDRTKRVFVLAVGGSDISNAKAGVTLAPTAVGTQNVTDPGFDTDAVLLAVTPLSSAPPQVYNPAGFTLGMGAVQGGSHPEFVMMGASEDNSSSGSAVGYSYGGECGATHTLTPNDVWQRCRLEGTITSGFQLYWYEAGTTQRYFAWLALAGTAQFWVDSFTQDTLTVDDQIARTGYGETPGAVLVATRCQQQATQNTIQAWNRISVGAATSTTERAAAAWVQQTGLSTTRIVRAAEYDAVGVLPSWVSPATQGPVTIDYTSVKSAGSWTNLANVASNDSNFATANPPEVVTGTIEVDDAPGDYGGSTIGDVYFEINWRVQGSGTQKRGKYCTLNWRKADTTLIHTYTTPIVEGTTERTDTQTAGPASGTSSLTTAEWNNSYIELIAQEEGGGPDDYYVQVDYLKIEVEYLDDSGGATTDGKLDVYSFDSDGVTFVNDEALSQSWFVGVFAVLPPGEAPLTAIKMEPMRISRDW